MKNAAAKRFILKTAILIIAVTTMFSLSQAHAWKFIATGDSRGSTNGVNRTIVSEIADAIVAEDADLVLVPGDLVNSGNLSDFRYWKQLMAPVYDAGIGVYPVRGNHDAGSGWVNVFGADIPDNGPSGEINYTYSVSHNNAIFIGMDQLIRSRRNNLDWLDDQLAANTNPHIFVFGHYPAFKVNHTDCLDDYASNRNNFWDSLTDAGSKIYFAGHDHFLDIARLDDGDGDMDNDLYQYIVGTMGAPPYSSGPYNGNNGYWTPRKVKFEANYGYVVVEITGDDVVVTWKRRASAGNYRTAHVFEYSVATEPQTPVAEFTASPTMGLAPLEVAFDASASYDPNGGTIVSYEWDFGDSSTDFGVTTSHRYDNPGTYTVELTVTNDSAETGTVTETITVLDLLQPYIVDNGDGGTSSAGTWQVSGGADPYGADSLYSNQAGATYNFEAAVDGFQEVSLWWTQTPKRCTAVAVEIYDGGSLLATLPVNQQAAGGQWNSLGTYDFSGTATVVINAEGGCSASADAVRFSPADPPPPQVIIDNGNTGTSSSGSWQVSGGANPYGADSLYSKEAGATYNFEAAVSGFQEVSLWWTQTSRRCTAVLVEIYDDNSLLTAMPVNQQAGGGQWNSLGTYDFSGTATVVINSEGGCSTSADAVRFSLSGPPPPQVIIDNGDAGTSSVGSWQVSSGANPYGANSLYSKEAGATYSFEAPISGSQEVSLWWTQTSRRCSAVAVEIYDEGSLLATMAVNQQAAGGRWNSLGTYYFSGTAEVVINAVGGCSTSADAVRFKEISTP